MSERVTIGVPVYRGEAFLAETLHCIARQTFREIDVLVSIDGPDAACEAIVEPFLADARFRVIVQPARLGWVGNFNWLLAHADHEFWLYQQQDDLIDARYVEVLVDHARGHPEAALVYTDMDPFGRIEGRFPPAPPVRDSSPFMRQMNMLHGHFAAFAFRGLARLAARRQAGPVLTNDCANFGADICWIAALARAGELHHVREPLYRKRYHASNTESRWWEWPRETKLAAWACHTVNMLEVALGVGGTAAELRLMWLAAVERLTSPLTLGRLFPVDELTMTERDGLLEEFLRRARGSAVHDVPVLLDDGWPAIDRLSREFFWRPATEPVEIVRFAPDVVRRGAAFNVQPDGRSAMWVVASRRPAPGSRIEVGGVALESLIAGNTLTAHVPLELVRGERVSIAVVGPEGRSRSRERWLLVAPGDEGQLRASDDRRITGPAAGRSGAGSCR